MESNINQEQNVTGDEKHNPWQTAKAYLYILALLGGMIMAGFVVKSLL